MSINELDSAEELLAAVSILREGGVIAHATEGVFGLSCDPENPNAVERILAIKGRDRGKGLIVIGGAKEMFEPELEALEISTREQIATTWPGAHTWILPNSRFSSAVTGGRDTIACRVPGHPQAMLLAQQFGRPIVSTSANRSGETALTTAAEVKQHFQQDVDCIVAGEVLNPGVPSTIHTLDGKRLR